ncbi:MAG: biotin/lipoyl-binding protein [Gemmataceae bacterium]
MLKRFALPGIAVVAAAFAVSQMLFAQQKPAPATPPVEPAHTPFAQPLAGAGIVEPETENIAVGTPVPGVVARVQVKVGDIVRPGSPLFKLDDRQMKAELDARLAALGSAEAQLEKWERSPRPEELPPAEAKLAEADANLMDQEQLLDRAKKLRAENAVSDEEFTRRQQAAAIARAQKSKAESELKLLRAGTWAYDKKISAAAVSLAKAQAEQTRTELDRLEVKAPRFEWNAPDQTTYKVLQVNIRPGEFVGAAQGPALIVLGYVGKLHVRVDIDENDIGRFRPELPGIAKPRGNPRQELKLKFVRVEPYVIPKKSLTGGNTERVDTRVLQVIYAITGDSSLYVGQQLDVFLDTATK